MGRGCIYMIVSNSSKQRKTEKIFAPLSAGLKQRRPCSFRTKEVAISNPIKGAGYGFYCSSYSNLLSSLISSKEWNLIPYAISYFQSESILMRASKRNVGLKVRKMGGDGVIEWINWRGLELWIRNQTPLSGVEICGYYFRFSRLQEVYL